MMFCTGASIAPFTPRPTQPHTLSHSRSPLTHSLTLSLESAGNPFQNTRQNALPNTFFSLCRSPLPPPLLLHHHHHHHLFLLRCVPIDLPPRTQFEREDESTQIIGRNLVQCVLEYIHAVVCRPECCASVRSESCSRYYTQHSRASPVSNASLSLRCTRSC